MLRKPITLNSLEITESNCSSPRNKHPFSPIALFKNRALAPKKGYGHKKLIPMHTIAELE